MAAKYALKKGSSGQFMFNLKSSNGQVILTSESYKEKKRATAGIESVRKNSAKDAAYERKTATNGKPFFVLKSHNGETIGKSEIYSSNSSLEKGIASVKKNGPVAKVDDQTA